MQTTETTAQVTAQGLLIIKVPVQLLEGMHSAVVVVDDRPLASTTNGAAGKLPVHDLGEWPASLSLRR